MAINLTMLGEYFKKNNYPVRILTEFQDGTAYLIFGAGLDPNGSLQVPLEIKDLEEILEKNNIIGENSLVQKQLALGRTEHGRREPIDKNIEDLIYNTLSKYVIQMLKAAMGEQFYKEIIPLEKHLNYFWIKEGV